MEKRMIEYYENGLPTKRSIRNLISDFVEFEAFVQFPCDYGYLPINCIRFAYEDSEKEINPLIQHLRKNGISILYIDETKLEKYNHGYQFQKWYDIGFFAFANEN